MTDDVTGLPGGGNRFEKRRNWSGPTKGQGCAAKARARRRRARRLRRAQLQAVRRQRRG